MKSVSKPSLLFGSALFALMACATSGVPVPEAPATSAAALASTGVRASKQGLDAQSLNVGECGVFLWTRRQQPNFVFFSKAASGEAQYWHEGKTLNLKQTGLGGDIFGQQMTEQNFTSEDGTRVELRLTPGEELIGGQRIPEASITLIKPDDWKELTPLAGVSVCQPAP